MFKSCKANLGNTNSLFKICSDRAKQASPLSDISLTSKCPRPTSPPTTERTFPEVLRVHSPAEMKNQITPLTSQTLVFFFNFFFFLISPLSPLSLTLALCQTKRPYVTRCWSLHVLPNMQLGIIVHGPPAVGESEMGLQAYKVPHGTWRASVNRGVIEQKLYQNKVEIMQHISMVNRKYGRCESAVPVPVWWRIC